MHIFYAPVIVAVAAAAAAAAGAAVEWPAPLFLSVGDSLDLCC